MSDQAPAAKANSVDSHELLHRAARFTVTVMIPVAVGLIKGIDTWLVFAVLGAILSFVGDEGGKPLTRLACMAAGPLSLLAGAALGTFITGEHGTLLAVAILVGIAYGLVESAHPHLLIATRFFGYGLVLAAAVKPAAALDALAACSALLEAWLISLAWDFLHGGLRPLLAAPIPALTAIVRGANGKWIFAVSTGISVALAFIVGKWLGPGHPYWTTLTILVVLRSEMQDSVDMITHRITGTLLGVLIVGLIVTHLPGKVPMLLGLVFAAALRWPAFRLHTSLGVTCLTIFVLLLGELLAATQAEAVHALKDRLLATFIGCSFGLFALALTRDIPGALRCLQGTSRRLLRRGLYRRKKE